MTGKAYKKGFAFLFFWVRIFCKAKRISLTVKKQITVENMVQERWIVGNDCSLKCERYFYQRKDRNRWTETKSLQAKAYIEIYASKQNQLKGKGQKKIPYF